MISKLAYLLIFLSLILNPLMGGEGSSAGNGGGVSENNLLLAWSELDRNYTLISTTPGLNLSGLERELLKNLRTRLRRETKTKLVFLSERKFDFQGRVYVTNSEPGSTINLNTDRLYVKNSGSKKTPLDMGEATALLTEILTRGDVSDLETLEDLKESIKEFFSLSLSTFTLTSYGREEIQISVYKGKDFAELQVMDSIRITDITIELRNSLLCDSRKKKILDLYNVHLSNIDNFNSLTKSQSVVYRGWISYLCGPETYSGDVFITVPYQISGAKASTPVPEKWWTQKNFAAEAQIKKIDFRFRDIH
jgi:hypothetical protein